MASGFRNLTVYKRKFDDFNNQSEEIGRLLNHMIQKPEKYK
jgi:hypothetical protein